MPSPKLFMILLGCKPAGRNTEQHDVFFGVAGSLPELVTDLQSFWPGSVKLHIDAWREVTQVDGYTVTVGEKIHLTTAEKNAQLFFINLGGYREKEFEEYHYKMLIAGKAKSDAIQQAKQTAFYKHTCFAGADSHIDDKYGIDVDDIYQVEDILPAHIIEKYTLHITEAATGTEDEWHLGYTKLSSLSSYFMQRK